MKKYILIVAGGKGLRMGGDVPKQFLPIAGKPVLMYTIEAFYTYDPEITIILVLPADQQEYWKALCKEHSFSIPHTIAAGGETRFHSVNNGLQVINDTEAVVGVHDGVRPFVAASVIADCYQTALKKGAVIPVIDIVETVRLIHEDGTSNTVNRDEYKLVQTPQVFRLSILKKAYEQKYSPLFTDDASVVEALGIPVTLVNGNRENIKITTPYDVIIAKALI